MEAKTESTQAVEAKRQLVLAFRDAAFKHDFKVIRIPALMIRRSTNLMTYYGHLAVHAVVDTPDEEALQLMLEYRANINLKNELGQTALHVAAFKRQCRSVSLLLKYKARVDIADNLGQIALHIACSSLTLGGDTSIALHCEPSIIASLLLRARADVNAVDADLESPLGVACADQNYACAHLLVVDYNANINTQDYVGLTPLMKATFSARKKRDVDLLRLLLTHQADANIQTDTGFTALMFACLDGQVGVPSVPIFRLFLRDEVELDMYARNTAYGNTVLDMLTTNHGPMESAIHLLKAAMHRRRQWQRVAILTMSIRATRGVGTFRYSILPLVRSIMTLMGSPAHPLKANKKDGAVKK